VSDEMIEEWDWDSVTPTGRAVLRDEAHRKGIPHEGVHLWILCTIESIPHILLQRRAPHKEFYPGYLDITVGGHVVFDQKEDKLGKESFEELGIIPPKDKLIDLGYFKYEESIPEFSLVHREIQHVWILFDDKPLDEYTFNDGEVDALAAVVLEEFRETLSDGKPSGGYLYDGRTITKTVFTPEMFHPLFFKGPMVEYMAKLFGEIDAVIRRDALR